MCVGTCCPGSGRIRCHHQRRPLLEKNFDDWSSLSYYGCWCTNRNSVVQCHVVVTFAAPVRRPGDVHVAEALGEVAGALDLPSVSTTGGSIVSGASAKGPLPFLPGELQAREPLGSAILPVPGPVDQPFAATGRLRQQAGPSVTLSAGV